MAHRTISIAPVSADISEEFVTNLLSQFKILRSKIDRKTHTAYVEFTDPDCLQALGAKYQDCKLKQLQNAEITLITYEWGDATYETPFNPKCLISIKKCDKLKLTLNEIKEVFQGFTVKKYLIYKSNSQIILELGTLSELQMLENNFAGFLVPKLGENACIDIENEIDSKKFIQKWTQRQARLEIAKKNQENLAEEMRNMEKLEQQRIERQMRIDKQYKQAKEEEELRNLRKQQIETQMPLQVAGKLPKMEIDLAKIHQAKSEQHELVKEKLKQQLILGPQKMQPEASAVAAPVITPVAASVVASTAALLQKVDTDVPSGRQLYTEKAVIAPAIMLMILLGWLYLLISS